MIKFNRIFISFIFSYIFNPFGECVLGKNPKILVTNPLMLFKLLRNFGHLIKHLGINYCHLSAQNCAEIERNYLAKYCSDSLERLYLDCDGKKVTFEHLQEPLKKLMTFHTIYSNSYGETRYLNDSKLPNLRNMIFATVHTILPLKEIIHYKNIECFNLISLLTLDKFPFSFENLKYLCIYADVEVNDAFCAFINSIAHLKTLKLLCYCRMNSDAFSKIFGIQNILSNLVEMEIRFHEGLSSELIIQFLKRSKNLAKIGFVAEVVPYGYKFDFYSNIMQFVSSELENEWSSYIVTPPKTLFAPSEDLKCYVLKKQTGQ